MRITVLVSLLFAAGCVEVIHGVADPAPAPVDVAVAETTPDAVEVAAPDPVLCEAPARAQPAWWDDAVGYEVFVRSFQDSDGDGIGDLKGLISRLDYLNDGDPATDTDLGVTLLWLMPVHASPSYHGYDVTDYRTVNPAYGTNADLDTLVAEAHKRGIRVVLDYVMNHTSDQHPWFVDSAGGAGAAHRDWYVWSDKQLGWSPPWGSGQTWFKKNGAYYYALFSPGMPDLDYKTAAVRAEMTDTGLFWLDRGIDGFRLDAARYLVEDGPGAGQADTPGTHQFWFDFHAALAAKHPDAMLVGEVWEKTSIIAPYFGTVATPELQMAFDFGEADAAVKGVAAGQGGQVRAALCDRLQNWPAWGSAGAFLTNHDQVRSATAMDAAGADGRALAAAWLLGGPGTPWIYYGEEIGLRNGAASGDEAKRLPMQWAAATGVGFTTGTPWAAPVSTAAPDTVDGQKADPQSLWSLYRRLIAMRAAHPALRTGATLVVDAAGASGTPIVLVRTGGTETVVAVFNFDDAPTTVTVPAQVLPAATGWKDLLGGGLVNRKASDSLVVGSIEARGFRFLATLPP